MAARAKHPSALTRRIVVASIVLAASVAGARPAAATNQWPGEYRKWPWRSGTSVVLTTLPGQCPHCSSRESSSAWKAIDAAMDYDVVYSISPGTVDAAVNSGGAAGDYLRIKDGDSYITYEHLSSFVVTGGAVDAGQPIAVSGASGNVTGAHLHFQRQDGRSFSSNALGLVPISGRGEPGDELVSYAPYNSDNGGPSYNDDGVSASTMMTLYKSLGGFNGAGATADISDAWTPCHTDGATSTTFRYACAPRSGVSGAVQTYRYGASNKERAFMVQSGGSTAYVLYRGILATYTQEFDGHDWLYWLGFPTGNRYLPPGSNVYRQEFHHGYITFSPGACLGTVFLNGAPKQQTTACD